MHVPYQGASVLYVDAGQKTHPAIVSSVKDDFSTVSLSIFLGGSGGINTQGRNDVPFGDLSTPNCWVWDESHDSFIYVQESPATVWTIVHGRGSYQQVSCFNANGRRVYSSEEQPNTDEVILTFNPALAGFAILK